MDMTKQPALVPAKELAARNRASFPNESAAYREARTPSLPRRSSFGGTSSGWPSSGASCRRAAR